MFCDCKMYCKFVIFFALLFKKYCWCVFSHQNSDTASNWFGFLEKQKWKHDLDLKVTPVTTDESFLSNQFNGYYTPYWVDKKDKKGGMMIFVKPCILSTGLANSRILSNTQIKTFKRILQKCNWLIGSISKAPSQDEKIFRFTFHKSVRILLSFLRKSHNS